MKRIAVLVSGRGSNLGALLAEQYERPFAGRVTVVLSNEPAAAGLALAAGAGIATEVVEHRLHPSREAFEAVLAQRIDAHGADLVVLAGFMRILTAGFVARFGERLINIHPSLLPAYPGLSTHRRALADGVAIHGCSVHFVTPALDHGPIIVQAALPVRPDDTETSLAARVLALEHRIYPRAVRWFCEGRLTISEGRVRLSGESPGDRLLFAPD